MKEIRLKEDNKEYIANIDLVDVKGFNTANEEGIFPVLKIKTFLLVDGKLKTNKNVWFPEYNQGKAVNRLTKCGINYQYGTDKQLSLLKEYGFDSNEKIILNIQKCIKILKENNLYEDGNIVFGKRPLISKLHNDIIEVYNSL